MRVSACITTRNRTQHLDACLRSLWNSHVKPHSIVVSDDSQDYEVQLQNQQVVKQYPGITYITGPRSGVCGNRNHSVNAIPASETDIVAFIDDDICVEPDFIERAIARYQQMSPEQRNFTILSGISHCEEDGWETVPTKLSFRGYFCATDAPQAVDIHAALFPRLFFEQEQWDENIFFGYEDAELCLRALKRGYRILHCPEIKVRDIGVNSTLAAPGIGSLSNYEIHIEAARLYVGIKRYKDLFPNRFKLFGFVSLYFFQMTVFLLKRGALQALPEIVRRSRIQRLWEPSGLLGAV